MNRRSAASEATLTAPFHLSVAQSQGAQQILTGKEGWEGTPRSPLTDNSYSTTGSQDSVSLELIESTPRSLWAMSARGYGQDGGANLDFAAASPQDALDRSQASTFALALAELPSPSLVIQDRLRPNARGRPARGGHLNGQMQPQGLLRRSSSSYRHLFKQVSQVGSGQSLVEMGIPDAAPTVEQLVIMVKGLPGNQPVIPVVAHGLNFMDSRAVAALLKEVAKGGLPQRAIEIFNWLRGLQSSHELQHLCDVYTYTTVIALCGQRQSLRLALELVAEMHSRGVTCNVHTYSALMNTCIKCGELELALDVFDQLKRERCVPNVVTFNTLVDVYGKLGRWQDAIRVIDKVYLEGLEPEARTFNTVIIAANICNQPLEALKVYERMLASGFCPTDTTYTALISAYGKAGQLENAMEVFDQMVQQNCERNIITYGSLISACDKAGRWELALRLLDKMQQDRVLPNTMTFSALLSACAQGGQSERAESLFHSMLARRCKPDAAAYNSLLQAHIRAGHWRAALQTLDSTPAGNKSEPWLYASLIHCLWSSGQMPAQTHATKLFGVGMRIGLLQHPVQQSSTESTLEVKVSAGNTSIAILGLTKWLCEMLEVLELKQDCLAGASHCILEVAGSGQPGGEGDESAETQKLSTAVAVMLKGLQSPFKLQSQMAPVSQFAAEGWAVKQWLRVPEVRTAIVDYLPAAASDSQSGRNGLACRSIAAQEAAANSRLATAHSLFCQAEKHQEARTSAAQAVYLGSREDCLKLTSELAKRLSIPADAVYRSMLLLDYALIAGFQYSLAQAALLVAACLTIAARSNGWGAAVQSDAVMETTLNLPPGALTPIVDQLQQLGVADMPVASPITAANQYLGLLLRDNILDHIRSETPNSPDNTFRVLGNCTKLLAAALTSPSTQHVRPSLMAAAAVAVDRRERGVVPVWPAAVARWTGLTLAAEDGSGGGAFEAAVRLVAALQPSTKVAAASASAAR